MKVVVAGGSGLIGRDLIPELAAGGHEVVVFSRSAQRTVRGSRTVPWDPRAPGPWIEQLRGADAVVNLCGESVGRGRWTRRRKRVLRESRIVPTRALVSAIQLLREDARPAVLVSASGTDVYEGRDEQPAFEDTPPVDTFLARLCLDWEAEAMRASRAGVRVVCTRFSHVIARGALSLERMALPFRLFLGGRLGSGLQWMSWVDIADTVGLISWAIEDRRTSGPLNVSAPRPVRQAEFATAIGRALDRPCWLATPAPLIRLVLGEQAILPLGSRRVWPAKALASGYAFRCDDLDAALTRALARR